MSVLVPSRADLSLSTLIFPTSLPSFHTRNFPTDVGGGGCCVRVCYDRMSYDQVCYGNVMIEWVIGWVMIGRICYDQVCYDNIVTK